MRQILLSCSLLTFLEDPEFIEAGLSADPDTTSLALPYQDAIAEWGPLFANQRASRREVTRANAVVAVRNQQLDRLSMRFAAAVRATDPSLLEKLFCGKAPGKFVRQPLRQQCEKTRDVMVPEIIKLGANHPLAAYAPQLLTSLNAALAALEARTKAKGARTVVAHEERAWKEGINTKRALTYGELLKIAATNKYPKDWADTFFPQKNTTADDEQETTDTPEKTDGT